jgi:hypothetical protein
MGKESSDDNRMPKSALKYTPRKRKKSGASKKKIDWCV